LVLLFFSHSDHVLPRSLFANLHGPTTTHGDIMIGTHTASIVPSHSMVK
jgi:hypothetical protein